MNKRPDKTSGPPSSGGELDPRIDALIGSKLRSYYDDLMQQPVPDRILDLLAQLDAKEKSSGPESKK